VLLLSGVFLELAGESFITQVSGHSGRKRRFLCGCVHVPWPGRKPGKRHLLPRQL